MKRVLVVAALAGLTACATLEDLSGGEPMSAEMRWRCEGGASFSAQILEGERARIVADEQRYTLPRIGPGAHYAGGGVDYVERGGQAMLSGAAGGPYRNCRR